MRIHLLVAFLSTGCFVDPSTDTTVDCSTPTETPKTSGSLTFEAAIAGDAGSPHRFSESSSTYEFSVTALDGARSTYVSGASIEIEEREYGIAVAMLDPGGVGRFGIDELDAVVCEYDDLSTCTPLRGTLDVERYDPSCSSPEDGVCTRFAARLEIEKPDETDGPSAYGTINLAVQRSTEPRTCTVPAHSDGGCDCRGAWPSPGNP